MRTLWYRVLVLFVTITCMVMAAPVTKAADVPRITKEDLKAKLCSASVVLLDVRTGPSWEKSNQKIKCAKRMDPDALNAWAKDLPKDKEIILYCA